MHCFRPVSPDPICQPISAHTDPFAMQTPTNVSNKLSFSGDVPYKDVGCFIDTQRSPRPLPELLFSDRDKISWKKWKSFMSDLICK
jgi:hypothetical protein